MRTRDEIVARIKHVEKSDWLGTQFGDLANYLDAATLKPLVKPDADLSNWQPEELTRENVIKKMLEYLDFAFEKASSHRGISASRSVEHMQSYLWLLGDDELLAFATSGGNYANYGVPILKRIAIKYDKTMPENILNWKDGEPCEPNCESGCGS